MSNLLEIRGLSRRYGQSPNEVVALDNVDFHVAPGEIVALMGPSGSGKSTLLTVAGALETATAGSVVVAGEDLSALDATGLAALRRSSIGFVFQHLNLLSALTAAENVAAPLELAGTATPAAMSEAREMLAEVGLADRSGSFPDDLSGGERQRVAIARALIGGRRLLLADEPTGSLDSATGQAVMGLLTRSTTQDRGAVIVTHDADVAAHAHRVVRIHDGRIARRGETR